MPKIEVRHLLAQFHARFDSSRGNANRPTARVDDFFAQLLRGIEVPYRGQTRGAVDIDVDPTVPRNQVSTSAMAPVIQPWAAGTPGD